MERAEKEAAEATKHSGEKERAKEEVTEIRETFKAKRTNSSRRAVLVAPSNFDTNPQTMSSNVFMKNSLALAEKLSKKSGRREMREAVRVFSLAHPSPRLSH